ncbi:MAG: O-antigen ligase family protein [Myxococcales bacterium]|nr:O-antigen ligase family protein [Myxococcales bacterium]
MPAGPARLGLLSLSLALLYSFGFVEVGLGSLGPTRLTTTELLLALFFVSAFPTFRPTFRRRDWLLWGLLAIAGSMLLTTLAVADGRGEALKFTARFAIGIVLYLFLRCVAEQRDRVLTICRAILAVGVILALIGIAQHFFPVTVMPFIALFVPNKFAVADPSLPLALTTGVFNHAGRLVVRASSLFNYCNSFAYFLLIAAGAAILYGRLTKERYARRFALFCLTLFLTALWFTYSRGTWLALAVGLFAGIVYLAAQRRRWSQRRMRLGLLIVVFVGLLVAAAFLVRGERTVPETLPVCADGVVPFPGMMNDTADADTFSTRLLLWRAAIRLWRESPWLGIGVDRFRYRFYPALPRTTYDLFVGQGLYQAHNLPLTMLCGQGIVGLVALVFFLFGCVREMRRDRSGGDPILRAVVLGMLAAIAAVNLYDAMLFDSYANMLLIGLVLALAVEDGWAHEPRLD